MSTRLLRFVSVGLALLLLLLAPAVALADDVMLHVAGKGAGAQRKTLVQALPFGFSEKKADKKLIKASKKLKPGQSNKARKAPVTAILGFAKKQKKVAAVAVAVYDKRKAVLMVVDTKGGRIVVVEDVPVKEVGDKLASALGEISSGGSAPEPEPVAAAELPAPEPEPEPQASTEDETPPASSEESSDGESSAEASAEASASLSGVVPRPFMAGMALEVWGGLTFGGRNMKYENAATANLRPYDVFGSPLANVGLTLFPVASMKSKWIAPLAVFFDFSQAFLIDSSVEGGQSIDTTWRDWQAGLLWRLPMQPAKLRIGFQLAYASTTFNLAAPADGTLYPSTSYGQVRIGTQLARPVMAKLDAQLGLGYRLVTGVGPLADAFPDASASGFDFGVGATYHLSAKLGVRGDFTYTHFGIDLAPAAGATFSAESASDNYLAITVAATYTL